MLLIYDLISCVYVHCGKIIIFVFKAFISLCNFLYWLNRAEGIGSFIFNNIVLNLFYACMPSISLNKTGSNSFLKAVVLMCTVHDRGYNFSYRFDSTYTGVHLVSTHFFKALTGGRLFFLKLNIWACRKSLCKWRINRIGSTFFVFIECHNVSVLRQCWLVVTGTFYTIQMDSSSRDRSG